MFTTVKVAAVSLFPKPWDKVEEQKPKAPDNPSHYAQKDQPVGCPTQETGAHPEHRIISHFAPK